MHNLEDCYNKASTEYPLVDLYPYVSGVVTGEVEQGLARAQTSGRLQRSISLEDMQVIRDCILSDMTYYIERNIPKAMPLNVCPPVSKTWRQRLTCSDD